MRLLTKRNAAIIVTTLVVAPIAWKLVWPPWTRTDTLSITAIDDGYEIFFHSRGRLFLPISPEGLFPKWSDGIRLFAEGSGEQVEIHGIKYKTYSAGKDLDVIEYSECVLYVAEANRRLILAGKMRPEYTSHSIDYSGTYENVTIAHPKIIPLTADSRIDDIDGCYVRAKGHFNNWLFESEGKTFKVGNEPFDDPSEYEVIGRVDLHYSINASRPYLSVISCKKTPVEQKGP